MACLLRLIIAALLFVSSFAHAALPLTPASTQYFLKVYSKESGWKDTLAEACAGVVGASKVEDYLGYMVTSSVPFGAQQCSLEINVRAPNVNETSSEKKTVEIRSVPASCPQDSTQSGSQCFCNSGFNEVGGKCVKKKDNVCGPLTGMSIGITSMESDFGPQSPQWAAGKLGKSGNACMSGCQTSGTITSCVAGTGSSSSTVCYLSSPSFTGEACTDPSTGGGGDDGSDGGKDKPTDCPVGYEPSQYVPGVCIPKPNDCPSGSSPSKYVEGVCIPNEKGDDGSCEDPKDPTKRAECEGKGNQCPSGQVQSTTQVNTCVPAKDGADKGKDGSKVECKDGKCTVTKPDGSKEDKGQDEVCKEQPDLAMCKESKGQFSGSCSANFRCDGDVLQCAALQEQHKRNCTMFDIENDMSRLFDVDAKKPQENVLTANGTEIDLKGHITVDSIIGNGQCPADVPLQVFGKTVVFKLSEFCRYFNAMGMLLFLSTCATCLRILGT